MVISGVNGTRAATAASAQPAQPVTAAQVKAQLSKFGGDALGWSMMCPEVVEAWSDVSVMGPALKCVADMGKGQGYWDRGVRANKAAMVWLDALVAAGHMPMPSKEWLQPMLIASLAMDIGTDGGGRTGHMFVSTGVSSHPQNAGLAPVALNPDLASRAAFLIGSSGKEAVGGLYSENMIDPARARAQAKRLLTETSVGQSANSLATRAADAWLVEQSLARLRDGVFLQDIPACVAAAEVFNVVKIGDRTRELAEFYGAGAPSTHLAIAKKHADWQMAVNFLAKCAAAEAGRN